MANGTQKPKTKQAVMKAALRKLVFPTVIKNGIGLRFEPSKSRTSLPDWPVRALNE